MQEDTLNLLFTKPEKNREQILLRLWSIAERVARRFKVPDGNAEDLTADILIHLLKKIPKLKPGSTAMGYFQRVARNKALDLTRQTWNRWRREHGARMSAVESAAAGGRGSQGGEGKVLTPAARQERRGTPPRPARKISTPEYINRALTRLRDLAAGEDFADAVHIENALLTARELIVGGACPRRNLLHGGLWIEVFSLARIDRLILQKSRDTPAGGRVAGIQAAALQALRKSLAGEYLPGRMPGDRWTPTRRITHDVGSAA